MLETILIIILVLALVGAFPAWPHSAGWGYWPGGIIFILLILFIFFGTDLVR